MSIVIYLVSIFLPGCVALLFSAIKRKSNKVSNTMSDDKFTIMLPSTIAMVGAMCAIMSLVVLLGFTFLSDERPYAIFYIVFGLFFWLGMYLIMKTLVFRVIVESKNVVVFPTFGKPYTFSFDEVVSAVRQVKQNNVHSERVVVKTTAGKRLIVESSEIAYKRWVRKIQTEVKKECLKGFE